MVVNFRGKDLNVAGMRVSGTKITATPDEINQALDGISIDVTAANLSALTGGAETDLHNHAASGGGGGAGSHRLSVTRTGFATNNSYQTVDFPDDETTSVNYNEGWTLETLTRTDWTPPVTGRYLVGMEVQYTQPNAWTAVQCSPPTPSASNTVYPPSGTLALSSIGGIFAFYTEPVDGDAESGMEWALQVLGATPTATVRIWAVYLGPIPS
jgi:hypothetical protein